MLKQTAKIVSYLIVSLLVGIIVTLVTDNIENIAVEKRVRKNIEDEIMNALTSFKESVPQFTPPDESAFVKRYVSTVMADKVALREHGIVTRQPDDPELLYLFTIKEANGVLDIYLRDDFLKSELSVLDVPDYISGILATIIVFTFIVVYTEYQKRALALQQQFEIKHRELSTALEQHEALALLGRMSAALAHELKTPVSTISNLIQTLPARHSDEQFVKRFIALTGEELQRTQQLIDNLLAYGKEIDLRNEEWISIAPFIQSASQGDDLDLIIDAPPNAMLYGDKFYLDLLFKNLFRNSREAGASSVRIGISNPLSVKEASAEITCEDDGTGFPEAAQLDELANPFVTSRSRGGGLGLYLAKKIVTAHDGTLSLFRKEKGAGVRIMLPRRRVKINGEQST